MTNEELVSYYTNLLCIQYKVLPNAQGTISALATEAIANQIYSQVLQGFQISTAIGEQLDILAQYVGAPRQIFGYNPSIPYMEFPSYSDVITPGTGFAQYTDSSDPSDFWISYTTSQTTFVLTDGQLRSLISYLIAVHASDHTLQSIDLILETFFGNYAILTDNEDMSITYTHQLSDPNQLFSIIKQLNFLPHPAGVSISVVEV